VYLTFSADNCAPKRLYKPYVCFLFWLELSIFDFYFFYWMLWMWWVYWNVLVIAYR